MLREPGIAPNDDREHAVTVKPDGKMRTPEAQLRPFIDRFDPRENRVKIEIVHCPT